MNFKRVIDLIKNSSLMQGIRSTDEEFFIESMTFFINFIMHILLQA